MTQSLESTSLIIILVSFSQVILNSLVWLIKGNSYFLLAIIVIFYDYCNFIVIICLPMKHLGVLMNSFKCVCALEFGSVSF